MELAQHIPSRPFFVGWLNQSTRWYSHAHAHLLFLSSTLLHIKSYHFLPPFIPRPRLLLATTNFSLSLERRRRQHPPPSLSLSLSCRMSETPFRPREKLVEKQKYYQSIHRHTYLKGPLDKVTSVAIPLALAASSLFLIGRGIYNMSHGIGKKEA